MLFRDEKLFQKVLNDQGLTEQRKKTMFTPLEWLKTDRWNGVL